MSGEAKRLSAEDREICRHFIQRRAYYYGVGPVGCEPINILLGAVNRAGKMYHHTEGWTEPSSYATTGDGSCVDIIDAAAYEAAEYISRIERERDDAQASLSWCLAPVPDDDPLRPLGSYLADAFDEDQWLTVEPLLNGARKRIAELEAENARLRADAERYQWLCANAYVWGSHFSSTHDDQVEDAALWIKGCVGMDQDGINAAIDAARGK